MTDDERMNEGIGDAIEDLEAPAAVQSGVAGGEAPYCLDPTCHGDTSKSYFCQGGTPEHADSCNATNRSCQLDSAAVVVSLY